MAGLSWNVCVRGAGSYVFSGDGCLLADPPCVFAPSMAQCLTVGARAEPCLFFSDPATTHHIVMHGDAGAIPRGFCPLARGFYYMGMDFKARLLDSHVQPRVDQPPSALSMVYWCAATTTCTTVCGGSTHDFDGFDFDGCETGYYARCNAQSSYVRLARGIYPMQPVRPAWSLEGRQIKELYVSTTPDSPICITLEAAVCRDTPLLTLTLSGAVTVTLRGTFNILVARLSEGAELHGGTLHPDAIVTAALGCTVGDVLIQGKDGAGTAVGVHWV
jgi:hypothetical protein